MLAQSRSSNQKHGNRWRSYFQFLETIDHGAAGGNDIIQGGKVKANLTATQLKICIRTLQDIFPYDLN